VKGISEPQNEKESGTKCGGGSLGTKKTGKNKGSTKKPTGLQNSRSSDEKSIKDHFCTRDPGRIETEDHDCAVKKNKSGDGIGVRKCR